MEFISSLSAKEIKNRLESNTEVLSYSNMLTENSFLSKYNKNNSFYLVNTGWGFFTVKPIHPFVGKIIEKENETIIVGNFGFTKTSKIIYGCFFGFAWVSMLSMLLFNENYNFFAILFSLFYLTIWTLSGYLLIRYVPSIFHKKMNQSVIIFIKENLLK